MQDKLDAELKRIDNFIDNITELADGDGVVTSDEQALLDEIFEVLGDYRQLLFDVMDDGVISEDERKQIKNFQDTTLNLINSQALKDGIISEDEEKIIDSLFSFLNE